MSVRCPVCKSFDVQKDERWRNTGTAAGAAIGSVIPVLGTAIGALTGGILGALTGGASGAATGHELGSAMDRRHNKRLYRCKKCGKLFVY